MRRRRNPEIIAGRVASTGAIVAGDGFTVARTVAGTYNVTLLGDFRLLAATATGAFGTGVDSYSSNGFRVQTYGTGLTITDFAFSFIAVAVQQ